MTGRFHLRTFGCQMNQRDAEQISNLLHHAGYRPAERAEDADVVVIHTCSVREKAESKLYSELGHVTRLKRERPGLVVGVGGCVAQQEGARLLDRFRQLDFAFGPQNLRHLPSLVARARERERSLRVDYDDADQRFDLPDRHPDCPRPNAGRAFVTVMEGCDLFCAFCVVPTTRGREVSRPSDAILDEVRRLSDCGVVEVTLLGQTVNAYGRSRPGMARGEIPFAELVRRVADVDGIERVRFTSPHPVFVSDDLIRAYADVPELCPHLHLPVQSGSDAVLEAMRRRYTRGEYLEIVSRLREARPGLAISTDLIVGFPGESDADFEQTLSLVREADFIDSFSFVYSARPGTPATRAAERGQGPPGVDPTVASARLSALQDLQRELTLRHHRQRVGQSVPVLVDGPSRRGEGQQQGRSPENRVVNFESRRPVDAGRIVPVRITEAQPHSLLGTPEADLGASSAHPAAAGGELPLV
ncbi:MAG: tRNA (N6-isopentenyl adenosine(37)-C2)-methylthiotransferase MiaB [Deltaproteobacteria bacterium]|nr:tRNA (N6-isopentenyl adenosine(37)-C2)-methylthiotransferase MiaB [Deltaproteobacteria bacterium]